MDCNKNQDSLMVECKARDLEVRVRIPVLVQIFLLKFMKCKHLIYCVTNLNESCLWKIIQEELNIYGC